jgi:uncharacterized membrane protein SirB2
MTKIILRIAGTLLVLHGIATFVAAKILPLSAIGDRLLFAQHGFTFIFVALLNLVIWQSASHGAFLRWTVHVSNLAFFLLYVAITLRNSEPPNVISAALAGVLFVLGLVSDYTKTPPSQTPVSTDQGSRGPS